MLIPGQVLVLVLAVVSLLASCSNSNLKQSPSFPRAEAVFLLKENQREYLLKRRSQYRRHHKMKGLVTRQVVLSTAGGGDIEIVEVEVEGKGKGKGKGEGEREGQKTQNIQKTQEAGVVLEKSISVSSVGQLKGITHFILRPKFSRYAVWFEGRKHFTEMKINLAKKSLDIHSYSEEEKMPKIASEDAGEEGGGTETGTETGTEIVAGGKKGPIKKSIPFPKNNLLFCFFSQIIECAKVSQFIELATEKGHGQMNLYVIWEGWPWFHQQYSDVPRNVFSHATLEYDGKNKKGERRLTLKVAGQSIFYFVDEKNNLAKKFWVSQGLSMTKKRGRN